MKWVLAEADEAAISALSGSAGLHPLVARLMVIRGITEPTAARAFLECELSSLSGPDIFSNMDRAVGRIQKSVSSREKITVYGDYDVDGVTGASLLYLVLKSLGADVECYLPDRMSEGYGLNPQALEKIKASGAGLVITVDCGISAAREAQAARALGLDLIITDHHELTQNSRSESLSPQGNDPSPNSGPGNSDCDIVLPDAYAVLHPSLLVTGVPAAIRDRVSGLTGVGIAFKLAQALLGVSADDGRLTQYLDLVTLGTIADVGRISGENRVIIKHGLDLLSSTEKELRPGVMALKRVCGLVDKKISAGTVGFTLAPRINASGRLERADIAFRMIVTESGEEAQRLASTLDEVNRARQSVEETIAEQAKQICQREDLSATGAFVLSSNEWHPGVIGIVASRIVEEFYRPAALISVKDGIGRGSARSIPGFDLYHGLSRCSDLLLGFGGHKYAAGFSIDQEHISRFRERLSALVMEDVGPQGFVRMLTVDSGVGLEDLEPDLMGELEKLAPFGQGNPEPRLGARGLEVVSSRIVGNNHLKLRLKGRNGATIDAIAFKRGGLLGSRVRDGVMVAAVFTPRINAWNGRTAVELVIKDIKIDNENSK
jgi:single-stranded-DNA-specific exonuclease